MHIKKQIFKLYAIDFLGSFNLTDNVWMLLLLARGFTLWQAGLCEGVFHLVSFLAEIPSGMLADIYGRRRIMTASALVFALASVLMIASQSLGGVCLAMGLNALGYNLASGTREALTYDSLKEVNDAARYIKVSSWQTTIWRGTRAVVQLLAGVALRLGYFVCYSLHIGTSLVSAAVSATLTEAKPSGGAQPQAFSLAKLPHMLLDKAQSAIAFLRQKPIALLYMLSANGVGGIITLMGFFIQQHFVANGAGGTAVLGPLLFAVSLGGVAGAKLAVPASRLRFTKLIMVFGLLASFALMLCSAKLPPLAALGGFCAMLCDEVLATVTDLRLNDMFPSAERATLVSVNSMVFSLVMITFSPILGLACDTLGTSAALAICAAVLLAFTVLGRFVLYCTNKKPG